MKENKYAGNTRYPAFMRIKRIIQITTLLLISIYVCAPLTAVAQPTQKTFTVNLSKPTLESFFDAIKEQTGYSIVLKSSEINLSQKVDARFTQTPLDVILTNVLSAQGLSYEIKDRHIIVYPKETRPANQAGPMIRANGVVVDERGEPIIGANITRKGTTNGTITDIDGKFSLEVPARTMLTVTYVGFMPQQVEVKDNKNIRVVIYEDTKKLEEVVVVGYGTMKKKDLMGATSAVSGNNLATNSNISVGSSLQGKMSGISILSKGGFPGSETSISIRGIGTFGNGDNSPLVVIDGVPVSSGFETLSPADIESVNVLKDASSAAIYGSRAANGVILVTTKKGSTGKGKVSVNASFGLQTPSNIMDVLTAQEFVSAIHEMRDNKKAIDGGNPTTKYDGLDPASFGKGTRWSDHIYDKALTYNVNANVMGGSEKVRYYISGEYLDQDGISLNSSFQKGTIRANVEGNVNKFLTVGNNVHLAYRNTEGAASTRFSDVIFNAPVIPAYDEDGSYGEPNAAWTSSKNAIAEVAWSTPTNDNYRVMDNLFVEMKFTDWLKFRFNGGIDMMYNEYRLFNPVFNDGGQTNARSSYTEERKKDFMWVTDYLLYFDKNFGKHTVNAMAGFSQQLFTYDNLYGNVKDFISEVDNMQVIDGGTNSTERNLKGTKRELALASYFGRINYDYEGRYLFSMNLRADGSSRFKANNRWGVFPSFSGAWRISEEKFFRVKPVSSLKLRASWGQLGNQSIGSWYPTIAPVSKQNVIFGTAADNQLLYAGYTQSALANKKLKWETTTVTNIGVDLGLFNSKLYINADYFIKNTDGILRPMVLPPSVGMSAPNVNYAEVQNRGFDLEIGYNGKVSDFTYSVSGNVSFLHNEIKKLSEGISEEIISIGGYGGVTINRVGEPISALYGYKTGQVITSKEEADKYKKMGQGNAKVGRLSYQDVDGNGVINGNDRVILGSHIPKVTAGLTLSGSWRNIDANMVFSGVFGRKQHSPMSYQNRMPNRNMSRKWYDNRWKLGDDPKGKYPAIIQSESYEEMTDLMVANTSFLKMKSLTVGYSYTLKEVKARLFLSGENLFTIAHKDFDGFDPENGNGVGHYTNWGDDYPTARIFLVGLNLTF